MRRDCYGIEERIAMSHGVVKTGVCKMKPVGERISNPSVVPKEMEKTEKSTQEGKVYWVKRAEHVTTALTFDTDKGIW